MPRPPRWVEDVDLDNLSDEDVARLNELFDNPVDEFGEALPAPTPARWRDLVREVMIAWGARQGDPSAPYVKIGRFDAEDVLGSGGFGCVFKVRDLDLDRLGALKLCIAPRPGAALSLMAEAKILAKLDHPNIVTVYETGMHGPDVFFVMQYVEGPSLSKYVTKSEPQPTWEELVQLFCVAGRTIADAHEIGIIHGDIKPSNILIELGTKKPYVADFGLARLLDIKPELPGAVGTLTYMAPELLRGGLSDAHSDQYAFCVALWECLDGGIPPYGGRDTGDFLLEIAESCPTVCNEAVPVRVRDTLRKGMSSDPSERFSDMRALVNELDRGLGLRVVVPQEPEADAGPKSKLNHNKGGLLMLVVLLSAGLLLLLLSSQHPQAEPAKHSDEVKRPEPPKECAESPWEPSLAAKAICTLIRLEDFEGADRLWRNSRFAADPQSADEWVLLIQDSLTVAKTFESEAALVKADQWRNTACIDYMSVREGKFKSEAEEILSSAFEGMSCD